MKKHKDFERLKEYAATYIRQQDEDYKRLFGLPYTNNQDRPVDVAATHILLEQLKRGIHER